MRGSEAERVERENVGSALSDSAGLENRFVLNKRNSAGKSPREGWLLPRERSVS